MQITKNFTCLLISAILISAATVKAQTTATWIGPASGGEWNTLISWDIGIPDAGTNAAITNAASVDYNTPMTAVSIGGLYIVGGSSLNLNAAGFNIESAATANCATIGTSGSSGALTINSGGTLTVTNSGPFFLNTNSLLVVNAGGTLLVTNPLATDGILVGANKRLGSTTNRAQVKIEGGTVTINNRLTIAGSTSGTTGGSEVLVDSGIINLLGGGRINNTSDDGGCRFLVNAGSVALGNFTVVRSGPNPGAGLVISNGVVNATAIQIGTDASQAYGSIYDGVLTNTGIFTVSDTINAATSKDRRSRFMMLGGTVVSTTPEGIIVGNQSNGGAASSSSIGGILGISGGMLSANGITLVKDNTLINAYGTFNLSGTGTVYLGSVGLVGNPGAGGSGYFVNFSGGTLGASADYAINADVKLASGTTTIQAADASGNPFNISASGIWSSAGILNKTGGGTLTMGAANTYSGATLINAGTLALGASGSLTSGMIMVGSGATFDVSANGAYALNAGQTLAGFGTVTGAVAAAASSTIYPGSNAVTGTLTLKNSLTENGSVNNQFNLSSDPNGPNNDFLNVQGDLNVSGLNTISIIGALPSGAKYALIHYGGIFNGDTNNFTLSNATGILSNSVANQTIYLLVATSLRGPTNLVWGGNAVTNDWDVGIATNWLNAGALDFFVANDNVLFSDIGAAYPLVNIPGTVTPASVVVNTTTNYVFNGTGSIGGTGSLTVSNGILTILNTNTYTGPTILAGGVLEVAGLALGGTPSSIGSATTDPGNLVFSDATLRYLGDSTSTDRGATFTTNSTATFDIYNSVTLTESGTLTGSGGLTKSGPGTLNLTGSGAYTGNTTLSNGVLQLNGTATVGTGALVFEGGTATLASSSSSQSYGNTLNVVTTGTLIVNGANANNIMSGGWTGSGTLDINIPNAAGYCTLNHAITTNFTGTIFLGSTAGSFRFNSGGNSSGAQQCNGSVLATFDLGTNTATFFNRNGGGDSYGTYYFGALTGGSGTIMKGSASANSASSYQIGDKNLSTTFKGTIVNGTGGSSATVAIVKTGTGTLTLEGANTYTGTTTVSNGVLALANNPDTSTDGSIDSSATINVLPGAYLDISGRSDGTLQLQPSQQLRGRGTILGSLNVSGTVAPGGGPGGSTGTLTVTNTVNLYGTAWMKLNRTNSPNSDRLVSSTAGIINYGGTLVVTNIGASLHVGDTFTLFSAATLNGSFTLVLPSYYTWDTSQLTVNGSVSVTAVLPLPSITTVDFSGLAGGSITLNANNGAPNGPVSILTSTNLVLPLSSWTTVTTTTFDGSGNLSLPITVDPTLPQSFYLLQVY